MRPSILYFAAACSLALVIALLLAFLPSASMAMPANLRDMASASAQGSPDQVLAPPSQPFYVYGTVKANGENVPVGVLVGAWCGGVRYAVYPATLFEGYPDTLYSLEIPGDDPDTTGVKEGCAAGETVSFTIGPLPADQTAQWTSGGDLELALTATGVVATPTASVTPTRTVTASPTLTPTASATSTGTPTATPTPTATASASATASRTGTASPTGTATPSSTPTASATPTRTPTGTATNTTRVYLPLVLR